MTLFNIPIVHFLIVEGNLNKPSLFDCVSLFDEEYLIPSVLYEEEGISCGGVEIRQH